MRAVAVHTANHLVRGRARRFPYFVASLFVGRAAKGGNRGLWKNTGVHSKPRRSLRLAKEDAIQLAIRENAVVYAGVGSLHNKTAYFRV